MSSSDLVDGHASGAPPPSRADALARRLGKIGSAWSSAEAGRGFLWAPVALGAGAAIYFSLRIEPSPIAAPVLAFLALSAALLSAQFRIIARAVFLISLGFAAADLRTSLVAAPQLMRELTPREVTGVLLSVDEAPKMRKLIVALETVKGVATADLPERARLTWRGKDFNALPGDRIAFRAGLSPPPPPSVPGGFDYARQLYFQKIGALGYAVSPPTVIARPSTLAGEARAAVENARLSLTRRILDAAPGDGGALVAATITGKREAISPTAEAELRDSGLAHLIAISGLNMALATGIIFFTVRFALAFIPAIALRYQIKKWAATAALLGGFAYLLISGGDWSAERAFIMTSIFFVAILFDRRALSLRNVAIAALIILVLSPEAVIHPGFQMSFAAVTALIAAYEWHSKRLDPDRSFSLWARTRRYVAGVVATDVIASTATGPFAIYHFNRAAVYGLPANVISIPIMGLWVMPVAMIALVLMPVGLDEPFWKLAAAGVDIVLAVARMVSSLPGSVTTFAQWPALALIALTAGGLWLCLQSAPWRLGAIAALPVAAAAIALSTPPNIFVTSEGDNAALVGLEGTGARSLALLNPRKDKFEAQVWKEHIGADAARTPTLPLRDVAPCDRAGCAAALSGQTIALTTDPLALADDCARADVVIALFPASRRAKAACRAEIIDRREVWDGGALAIWVAPGEMRIESVNGRRGRRPWTQPQNTPKVAAASTLAAGSTYKAPDQR
ncbi:MAG: ComEC/Rec2 family competence protein [Parvularculaceae bacterium]